MKRAGRSAIIIMAILASVCPSYSQDKPEEGKGVEVSLSGYERVRHTFIEDVDVSKKSNTSYFQQRLRLEPTIRVSESVKLIGEVDIFDDVIFGNNSSADPVLSTPPTSQGPDGSFTGETYGSRAIDPKRFYADVYLPFGKLQFGRMPSHWGLGILDNDGIGFKNEWGDAHFGTTRDRILFATKPLGKDGPLAVALGFDKMHSGTIDTPLDDVQQVFIIPVYNPVEKKIFAGIYAAYRSQDSTKTNLYSASGYGDVDLDPLRFQLEAVWVGGATEAFKDFLLGQGKDGKTDVSSLNSVLRATYTYEPFKVILEGGFASGQKNDSFNPLNTGDRGSKITSLGFNPDYNVGLILFEETLLRKTARAAGGLAALGDPEAEFVSTNGSVRDAWYIAPLFRFDLTDAFGMKLGLLYAHALDPVTDPNSRPTYDKNYDGGRPSRELGWEVDYGLHFALADNFDFGVQLGYLIPGKAFADSGGKTVNVFETQTRLTVSF